MGEIFKLFGTIGVDNKEAKDALTDTEKQGEKSANKLTNFFKNMSTKVGKTLSGIGKKLDLSGMNKQFNAMGGKINSALSSGVIKGAKTLAVGGAAAMAGAGAMLVKSMNFAGELEQNMGGSEAVFGKYANNMQKTGVEAYKNMGLSQSDFLANANKMGSLFQGAGFSVKESMSMTSDSMQRASDVASIMGIDVGSAMEAVSGMAKGNFEMMDNLGVAMNDTTIGNYALSKGIEKSTSEMTTQEKVGLATQMFMEKTAKYAGNYAKENESLAGSLQTAKGALGNFLSGAGDIDAVIESGMQFAGIAAKSAGELAPKLFAGISEAVATLIPKIPGIVGDLADGMATTIGKMFGEKAQSAFETAVDAISEALNGLKTAFNFIAEHKDIFTPIAVGIGAIVGFLSAWNAITKVATVLQTAFNIVLNANPLGLIILAVVGVVSALTYFFTQTETGKKVWKDFMEFLSNLWQGIKDKATEIFNAIKEFISNVWTSISTTATEVWTAIATTASNVWTSITTTISNVIQGLADTLSTIWNTIKTVAQTVWNVLFAVVGGIILSGINIVMGIFEGLKLYMGIVWNAIKGIILPIINAIVKIATAVFNGWKNIITTVFNAIRAVITTVWNAISGVITTVVKAIVTIATNVFNILKNRITTIFNAIRNVVSTVWNAIKNVISTVVNAIVTLAVNTFNNLKNRITTIFNAIRSVASSVWNAVKNVISSVVNSIKTTVSNVFNAVKNTVSSIFNSIKSTASNIWNGLKSTISNVVNGIKSTVSNVFNGLKSTVSSVWNGIKSAIETPINKARDLVKSAIDAIKGFFNFKFTWPNIPLPHFSVKPSGWEIGDLLKGKIPSLGISWHAEGGIFNKPTLLGDGTHGVGEAGAEAVTPLDTLFGYIVDAMRQVMAEERGDGDINVTQYISSPDPLTPREIARQTKLQLQDLAALK